MTAEEFFIEQFNKCTWIEDNNKPGNIFMVYDKHHERKIKMNSILGNKNKIEFIKTENAVIFFCQDYKNGYLYCNYNEVWSVFEEEYGLGYKETEDLISGILDDYTKLKQLTPILDFSLSNFSLDDYTKLKQLTPVFGKDEAGDKLDDYTKLKQLTPGFSYTITE